MTPNIHVFSAPADKFFVNSFIVEGENEVVVIDVQFLLSTAAALAEAVSELRKTLAAVIITHPHPDHFNGLDTILEAFGPVPVYANRPTIDTIKSTRQSKRETWTPVYGSDYPQDDAIPDHPIGADETLRLAGIDFRVIDLGPGESADNTVIHIPAADALIASDLVYHDCHPWLAEHRSARWLEQLDRVQSDFGTVSTVYAGHGQPGGPELFDLQRQYILQFRELVKRRSRQGQLDDSALAEVKRDALRERAGWPLSALVDMNANAMAAETISRDLS